MSFPSPCARLAAVAIASAAALSGAVGQEPPAVVPEGDAEVVETQVSGLFEATWQTRNDVRSLNLEIPPPRGQIVDRHGSPLATNRICNYLALQLPGRGDLADEEVLRFAEERLSLTNKVLGKQWEIDTDELLQHYRNRRWMLFPFSPPLKDFQVGWMRPKIAALKGGGLTLLPTYCRVYPQGETAGHIIGYSGRRAAMATGVPMSGEPIFPFSEGREGLEAAFEEELQGEPGQLHRLYGPDGELLAEEMLKRPVPGGHLVTTLDLGMQKLAEHTLSRYCRRGALVVLDVRSGDVLAMASRPGYDPNVFLPYIGEEQFAKLRDDPSKPLFPRAYAGAYPPASTFKVVTALAGLEGGIVEGDTRINSPGYLTIYGRKFRNWHSGHEGKIDVKKALARSCNTWFYRVGMDTGAENFCSMAQRLGYGEVSGLPLSGEVSGTLPTEAWMQKKFGHGLADGYLANAAIGQGQVLSTPLQVAQMMAGVANRHSLPQLRLASAVLDVDGQVVKAYPATPRNALKISQENLDLVTTGLTQVVHAGYGTGKNAANGHHLVAGKTGTGQWGAPAKKQYVAWFAGFVPAGDPQYAFAALYEGRPGEFLSGGKKAAPIVASYFSALYGGAADRTNSSELAKYKSRRAALGLETAAAEAKPKPKPRATVASNTRSSSQRSSSSSGSRSRRSFPSGGNSRPEAAPRPAPMATPVEKKEPPRRVLERLFGKRKR